MIATCKKCGKAREKICEKRVDPFGYVYLDELGKRWHGKICPRCHRLGRMLSYRYEKTASGIPGVVRNYTNTRAVPESRTYPVNDANAP